VGNKIGVAVIAAALVAVGAFALASRGGSDDPAEAACGPVYYQPDPSGQQSVFPVKVIKGYESCETALETLHSFLTDLRPPDGWACFYGHGQDDWAATCARPTEADPEVVIRAYNS
jgi:hypothetical protein